MIPAVTESRNSLVRNKAPKSEINISNAAGNLDVMGRQQKLVSIPDGIVGISAGGTSFGAFNQTSSVKAAAVAENTSCPQCLVVNQLRDHSRRWLMSLRSVRGPHLPLPAFVFLIQRSNSTMDFPADDADGRGF